MPSWFKNKDGAVAQRDAMLRPVTPWGQEAVASNDLRDGVALDDVPSVARTIGPSTYVMLNSLVGTSSWTDKSLIESGRFYPRIATTPEDRLRYYASQFPIVEIDSSYYGIPTEANARLWVERTPTGV